MARLSSSRCSTRRCRTNGDLRPPCTVTVWDCYTDIGTATIFHAPRARAFDNTCNIVRLHKMMKQTLQRLYRYRYRTGGSTWHRPIALNYDRQGVGIIITCPTPFPFPFQSPITNQAPAPSFDPSHRNPGQIDGTRVCEQTIQHTSRTAFGTLHRSRFSREELNGRNYDGIRGSGRKRETGQGRRGEHTHTHTHTVRERERERERER